MPLVVPEDDQAFLERHKNAIEKQEHVKKKKEEKEVSLQSPASTNVTPIKNDSQKEAFRQNFLEQMKKASPSHSTTASPSAPSATESPVVRKSESIGRDEMKSFFNNLLKKDSKS